MRILSVSLLITAALFLFSCNKDEPISQDSLIIGDKIQFDQLEVGQKNEYVLFIGENYNDISSSKFVYYTDTLILEIVSEDEQGFLAKEYLSPGSASLSGASNVAFPDSEFFYYLNNSNSNEEQKLELTSKESRLKTRLFQLSSSSDASFLLEQMESTEVQIIGWSSDQQMSNGVLEGYTRDYEHFTNTYPRLNVLIDNRDVQYGAPGTMNIYHKKYGLVRAVQYNLSNGKGFGWDLLP